ncbi:MAG: hypothetical protein PHS82_09765 [Lachnospiraceae bacterium]|nr:hypothetical protein [Lachnospiraceae bacterium]
MNINYNENEIKKHMHEGGFGLEKESLRVNRQGMIADSSHPFGDNPHMERDFCESQTELITRVCDSVEAVWLDLLGLQKQAVEMLEEKQEVLWPFSNPPYVEEEKISVAQFNGEKKGKEQYREYLAEKYGKRKMLYSGIHFNFSFSGTFLKAVYRQSGAKDYACFKNQFYLELAAKSAEYSWLMVYLTAASPVLDGSFVKAKERGRDIWSQDASPRCGSHGYWNKFVPVLDYASLDAYTQSIQKYVDQGRLKSPAELYYPIRLKPAGENTLENLCKKGVNHIELRMLDVNPLSVVGIKKEDLDFLHLFLLYLMSLPETHMDEIRQKDVVENEKSAAMYEDERIRIQTVSGERLPIRSAALQILQDMEKFAGKYGNGRYLPTVRYQEKKIICPKERYAVKIRKQYGQDYVKKGLQLAEEYGKKIFDAYKITAGNQKKYKSTAI